MFHLFLNHERDKTVKSCLVDMISLLCLTYSILYIETKVTPDGGLLEISTLMAWKELWYL